MSEVHTNVPSTVKATGKTGAEKEKMLAAVAFSKAKDKGAKVPKKGSRRQLLMRQSPLGGGRVEVV